MSELDELRQRVAALESQGERLDTLESKMERLRHDAVTTRSLAVMADRDVAEMRTVMGGHTQVLNALRETQVEHGAKIQGIEATLKGMAEAVGVLMTGQLSMAERQNVMDERLVSMDERQAATDERLASMDERQVSMAELLQRIADRLDVGSPEA